MTRDRSKTTLRKDIKFAQIPEWVIFHPDLTPQAVKLYCVLARYSDDHRMPSRKRLAERMGTSISTIDRALELLESARAVTVIERYNDAGDRDSNGYEIHFAPPEGVASRMTPPPATSETTGAITHDETGGRTDDAPIETAISRENPLPPASGGTIDAATDTTTAPRCARPGPTPHNNCRNCGTTGRQLADQAKRDAAAQQRADADAAWRRQRAEQRAAATPPPAELRDRVRQLTSTSRSSS